MKRQIMKLLKVGGGSKWECEESPSPPPISKWLLPPLLFQKLSVVYLLPYYCNIVRYYIVVLLG